MLDWEKEDKSWPYSIDRSSKEESGWECVREWEPKGTNKVHLDVEDLDKREDQVLKEGIDSKEYKLLVGCS